MRSMLIVPRNSSAAQSTLPASAAQQAHAAAAAQRRFIRGGLPSGGVAWLPLGVTLAALGRAADARAVVRQKRPSS